MTPPEKLAQLLDSGLVPPWAGAEGLLACLAAAALAPADVRKRLETALGAKNDAAWSELRSWVSKWPDPPLDQDALTAWLHDTEDLGLAQIGLAGLNLKGAEAAPLAQAIAAKLGAAAQQLSLRHDGLRFAGEGERRQRELGTEIPPWCWFRGGRLGEFLDDVEAGHAEVCQLWVDSRLHSKDAEALRDRLQGDDRLLAAYRGVVSELAREIWVTRWTPAWSLDVARNDGELAAAQRLLWVELPHAKGALDVRQYAEGTWWSYPGQPTELLPFTIDSRQWGDDVLGELLTRIHVATPTAAEDVWHGLASLRRIAAGDASARGVEVARTLVADLADLDAGAMAQAVRAAHDSFESGGDLDAGTARLLDHAFEARVLMPEAIKALSDAGASVAALEDALTALDDAHGDHSSAALLVTEELYEELTDGVPLDDGAWWGSRALLDRTVPRGVVEGALRAIGASQINTPHANVVSLEAVRERRRRISAPVQREITRLAAAAHAPAEDDMPGGPCPWLAAADLRPRPGRVPVLLLDEARDVGVVGELRVTVGDQVSTVDLWSRAPALELMAREAIRDAYYAAASETPLEAAPYPFAQHRVELVVDATQLGTGELEVDGASLGLSAAIAFASCWLGQPMAADHAPMATVNRRGTIGAVRGGAAKAKGAVTAGQREIHVLAVPTHADEIAIAGATLASVGTLGEALERLGLTMAKLGTEPYGSVNQRLQSVRELCNDIQFGNLEKYGAHATWETMGDTLRRLVDSLRGENAAAAELPAARCMAALAYSHAGLAEDVGAMLAYVARPTEQGLPLRALYDLVALGRHIDQLTLDTPDGEEAVSRLAGDLEELRESGDIEIQGRATGSLGRAYMHARQLDEARPLLEEAVRHHLSHARHETARSRVYLAMALRMDGEAVEGLEELVVAQRELETVTRRYSPEYEARCRVFLDYELARVLIALDRPDEALAAVNLALEEAPLGAWWPRLGILRARAWALRMCDQADAADADVEAMRRLAKKVRAPFDRLANDLIEEAEDYPIADGEVY